MKRSQFKDEQIIGILREGEAGAKTAELCRRHEISAATLYNWKAKFGGMDVSEAKRLRTLEDENAKLKRLLADAMLDLNGSEGAAFKKMIGPGVQREAIAHLSAAFLNEALFVGLDHARKRLAAWAVDYNTERPHSALGWLTPAAFAAGLPSATGRLAPPFHASPARALPSARASRPVAGSTMEALLIAQTLSQPG